MRQGRDDPARMFQTGEERVSPTDVDGMVRGLRDTNARTPGGQRSTDHQLVGSMQEMSHFTLTDGADPRMGGSDSRETTKLKTVDNNQAAPSAPRDFVNFDIDEMERLGNALFHAKDDWARASEGSSCIRHSSTLSEAQAAVENWWKTAERPADESIATFLKNRTVIENIDCPQMLEALKRPLCF